MFSPLDDMKRHAFRAYLRSDSIGDDVDYFVDSKDKYRKVRVRINGQHSQVNMKFLYVTHDLGKIREDFVLSSNLFRHVMHSFQRKDPFGT